MARAISQGSWKAEVEVSETGPYAIELLNITKVFKETVAVRDLSVNITQGEFFSLLGPSGCGKTTTLRIIAGLEAPTTGRVILEGRDVTELPAYRRNVNTVFQDYALFPHMTVYENVYFPLKMRKVPKAVADPKIKSILKLVNMQGFEKRYPHQLSGGQRQRIALARALVNEPKALLLDEPLGALDFKLRIAMQKVLKDIQRRVGITFIYVTHDQTEAITMSDRIAVMKDGVVHQIGTPDEIYNRPQTAFVASFIGDMNFLRGRIHRITANLVEVDVAGVKLFCERRGSSAREGSEVLLSIRPEKVYLNPDDRLENRVSSTVSRVVFRGDDFEVSARFGDSVEVRSIVNYKDWDRSQNVGDPIEVGWSSRDALLFPLEMKDEIISYE